MKKKISIFIVLLLTITLYGCPNSPYLFNYESIKSTEALFDLPKSAFIVSETFTFDELANNYFDPKVSLTAEYEIKNDGEDEVLEIYIPYFPVTARQLSDIEKDLVIKSDNLVQELDWNFRFDQQTSTYFENFNFNNVITKLVDTQIYQSSEYIYTYEFTVPLKGENQEMTIEIPQQTKVITDYYYEKLSDIVSAQTDLFDYSGSSMTIKATDLVTTGRFYTIGKKASIITNYDCKLAYSWATIDAFASRRSQDRYSENLMKYKLYNFVNSDETSISSNDVSECSRYSENILSVYSSKIDLPGNGETTIIEVTYPFRPGAYTDTEKKLVYFYYDFYFDTERYLNKDIDVSIVVNTESDIFSSSYDIFESNIIIFDIEKGNHLEFTLQTVWLELG